MCRRRMIVRMVQYWCADDPIAARDDGADADLVIDPVLWQGLSCADAGSRWMDEGVIEGPRAVIITRPHDAAKRLSVALEEAGVPSELHVISPLFAIRMLAVPHDHAQYEAMVFTSENGVAAIARARPRRGLKAYCVGSRTATVARQVGFEAIAADGTSDSLADLIAQTDVQEPILYVRGRVVARDLASMLKIRGVALDERVMYEQVPQNLSARARAALHTKCCILPLFSEKTAIRLDEQAGDLPDLGHCVICMSGAIAQTLRVQWTKVVLDGTDISNTVSAIKARLSIGQAR